MKLIRSFTLSFCVVASLAFFAGYAEADWFEDMGGKWIQRPVETTNGLDVGVFGQPDRMLADDFQCTFWGPITNIHIWGSWKGDHVPPDPTFVQFRLTIWSDNPNGISPGVSAPEFQLWFYDVPAYDLIQQAFVPEGEGWYNPEQSPTACEPGADSNIWQYNFDIPIEQAFVQRGSYDHPVTYWLGVEVFGYPPEYEFGWKTSTNYWMDDAVWGSFTGEGWTWQEMIYPDNHPFHNAQPLELRSINLAFVIESGQGPSEPKWSQPLDTKHGRDVLSYVDFNSDVERYALDDFVSDGRPITAIRWWGSYPGWMNDQAPMGGMIAPPFVRPQGFWVDWRSDIPANVLTDYSLPGDFLNQEYHFPLLREGLMSANPGEIIERYYTSTVYIVGGVTNWEHEYVYELVLNQEWREKEGTVYWLGIEALYWDEIPEYPWGWATTLPRYHWNDDAVQYDSEKPPPGIDGVYYYELFYNDLWSEHPYTTNSVDLAFELLTDVLGRRAKKWWQMPDMTAGVDMVSMVVEEDPGTTSLRADDFVSDGRLITDIHWWGSYVGWEHTNWYTQAYPPPPTTNVAPIGFNLSWHENGDEEPGPTKQDIFVPFSACHEVFYGSVTQYWDEAGYEHEFQYYVDLLDHELEDWGILPWEEQEGVTYWLNIQAVYESGYEVEHEWGWKITTNIALNPSVVSWDDGGSWEVEQLADPHPRPGPFDLAFELTTTDVGTNSWYSPIVISNIARLATNTWLVESIGTHGSGTQYLQECRDLMITNWTDVDTNALPWPPPALNPWFPPVVPASNRFFRVIEK